MRPRPPASVDTTAAVFSPGVLAGRSLRVIAGLEARLASGFRGEAGCPGGRDVRVGRPGPGLVLAPARPRGGPEHLVPVRRADAEPLGLVLKVMAHVPLAQHPAQAPARAEVMYVVVDHVVRQVSGKKSRPEPGGVGAAEGQI